MKLKHVVAITLLLSICLGACKSNQSATDKRIKKQEKHRKKHPCPQIDC
ncbi:MAG TPA: hypothetical protein VK750_02940 [Cytophagaceae bacterium]|nr:hypothetical protein [Cytophagaceae bacterium]